MRHPDNPGSPTGTPTRRGVLAGLATAATAVLSGCSVTAGSTDDTANTSTSPHPTPMHTPLAKEHSVIDFTTRPTRQSMGLPAGQGSVTYPKGNADPIDTTLRFPTGDVPVTLFEIDISTNDAMADDPDPSHEPKYFDLYQHFDNYADLDQLLHKYQQTLGISNEDLKIAGPEGTTILQGFVHDWLSLYLEVRTSISHGWNLIYVVTIDRYHNPAVNKILHDNKLTLDLTHRPTRADLAFLPSYDGADIWPLPDKTLDVALRTDRGTATFPITSLIMSRASGPGPEDLPTSTNLDTTGTTDTIKNLLPTLGHVLGFDSHAAIAFINDTSRNAQTLHSTDDVTNYHASKTLTGTRSPHVSYKVRIDAAPRNISKHQQAGVVIWLTYH